jgi:hypothetical protein
MNVKVSYKNITKTAGTRLRHLTGNEQELPEGDMLALKLVGGINKETVQYTVITCAFFVHYTDIYIYIYIYVKSQSTKNFYAAIN